jgi:flagellar basal body P-ring formation protein FlgA
MGTTKGLRALALALGLLAAGAGGVGAQARGAGVAPMAARDLPRGAVLVAADIALPGPDSAGSPVGWVTRRVVAAGELLREPTIAPPPAVTAGERVQLLWQDGVLEVRLRGQAMGSAALGERVTVRVDARRRFEGVAVRSGVVRIETQARSR